MSDTPLGRARQALLDAKAQVALKDTPTHRQAVAQAMAHLDYLLDTLPIPPTPTGPAAHRPGPVVSLDELLEGECDSTTAQQVDGSGVEQ